MAQEIEYKFLVDNNSWQDLPRAAASCRIIQGYLAFGDQHTPTVRIRITSALEGEPGQSIAELTVKGWGELSREEIETVIDIDRAREMLALCQGRLIEKVRHRVKEKHGLVFEVDEFQGEFSGLVVAEVEVPSEDTVFDRQAPFLGREVTREAPYKNAVMARDGVPVAPPRNKPPVF